MSIDPPTNADKESSSAPVTEQEIDAAPDCFAGSYRRYVADDCPSLDNHDISMHRDFIRKLAVLDRQHLVGLFRRAGKYGVENQEGN